MFYTYILFDWMGIPRYVGKGKGNRDVAHEQRPDPINLLKNEFIEQTWTMLGEIPKIRVRENMSEVEAFETEIALIKALGRIDLSTGPLTNMTDGGDGGAGASLARWAKPGARERASVTNSARYATPEGKARAREIMNRPETVAKLSAAAKRQFEDPAQLEANRQRGIERLASPEARAAMGEMVRTSHARPEIKAKMRAAKVGVVPWNKGKQTGPSPHRGKKQRLRTSVERQRHSEIMTEVCKRPDIREMRRQAANTRWARQRAAREQPST